MDQAVGGATRVIRSDPGISLILMRPAHAPDTTTGTWQLDGDVFKMYPSQSGFDREWDIAFAGSMLTQTGADVQWDFQDGSGLREAEQNLVLIR